MATHYDRLSTQDINNLWADGTDSPMHIIAVLQLEPDPLVDDSGQLRLDEIRRRVVRRLDRAPRLRQVVRIGSLLTGPPVWIDEVGFDLDRHLRTGSIPAPGGEGELLEVVARIDEQRLDRSHAPWEMWLLTGVPNGRIVLVVKLHHVMADGLAAVQLMGSLFDFNTDGDGEDAVGPWQPTTAPERWDLIRDNGATKVRQLGRALVGLSRPVAAWHAVVTAAGTFRSAMRQATGAPRSSINQPIGARRRLGVVRISLDAAKAVAHAHGGKVNDLVLALVAGGLRSVLVKRGEPTDGVELLASVPVSLRHDSRMGNEVGAIIVPLAIAVPDANARLDAVMRAAAMAKRLQSAATGTMVWSLLARTGLIRMLSRRQRFVNLFVTNVAGPPMPVDVLGARLLDVIPITPIAGNCTLSFAALSYNGCLAITAVADADLVPDLDTVIQGMLSDWVTLKVELPLAVAAS
ncbi:MAG TPA: wax ester/triacylglycerol synthase family O-acyltransferase [Candidatus Acidoferrum sp.]|nr:wax ester/triacylglycerol synthase family O-acyltransferase [Candidatus Acidoferrum sp.]